VINGKKSLWNPALVQVWGSLDSKPSQQYLIQYFRVRSLTHQAMAKGSS
jgi:hypothetical protein